MPNESSVRYQPETGHRVRVVLEGEVLYADDEGFTMKPDNDHVLGFYRASCASVERLPDPEPEWAWGAYVIDATSVVWRRTTGGWLAAGQDGVYSDDVPSRPLRLLVSDDGKVVQA